MTTEVLTPDIFSLCVCFLIILLNSDQFPLEEVQVVAAV